MAGKEEISSDQIRCQEHEICKDIEVLKEEARKPSSDKIDADEEIPEVFSLSSNVGSKDFLSFQFRNRRYGDQIKDAIQRTGRLCAISSQLKGAKNQKILWLKHHFDFMGGSLGCAEGEVLTQGFEYAREHSIPVVVECRSGGARIQEGILSLMQMAKVSSAVHALRAAKVPFVSLFKDPTFGGVSASYAMQSDVRVALHSARVGFAGPQVILNTVYEMDQDRYDEEMPSGFQTSTFLKEHGQVDIVVKEESDLEETVMKVLDILWFAPLGVPIFEQEPPTPQLSNVAPSPVIEPTQFPSSKSMMSLDSLGVKERLEKRDYLQARHLQRYNAEDFIGRLVSGYVELHGDGRVGHDACIRGGIGSFEGRSVVVVGTFKGHTPAEMQKHNFGMPSPDGYRFALRMMKMAEHFGMPVISFVDTVGAYPNFESEEKGQFEAIATNLREMAGLKVPIVSIVTGEGGSGGALGIAMANRLGMLSRAWYSVISPEGGASILGRYTSEQHKAKQFPLDCQTLARAGYVYAEHLSDLGVVDTIIEEPEDEMADFENCDVVMMRAREFIARSLVDLSQLSSEEIVNSRYRKFRNMGQFTLISRAEREELVKSRLNRPVGQKRPGRIGSKSVEQVVKSKTLQYIANTILHAKQSAWRGTGPKNLKSPDPFEVTPLSDDLPINAKSVLDAEGPIAMRDWVLKQTETLITDTTMRDAHQSVLATRMRTRDMVGAAPEVSRVLHEAFSLECWGGATFDVVHRFLHECPWERLREIRRLCPNICLQMLVRGSNVVGYTNYPDNLIMKFVECAANAGIDVFRIFDCFNDLEQMKLTIKCVIAVNKVAEVCMCFSGNFLSEDEKIYHLDYWKSMAKQIDEAGAHILCIKDMAGLLKPQMAQPLIDAIREVTSLPIHFHTHNTSSAALTTCINMANAGCDIIDFASASMADTTSQPSLNAFLASMEGTPRSPKMNYLSLEPLDIYWGHMRNVYNWLDSSAPMKTGSARVYDHQIPGGQYSNLMVQCRSMGIFNRWAEILDMYRDCNLLFGDVIKVTPSSKCIGDMALYLIRNNITIEHVKEHAETIEWPQSVIDLCMGNLGFPHMGLPKDIQSKVLRGKEPNKARAGTLLDPFDFEAEKKKIEELYGRPITEEELVSALLYPAVHENFNKYQNTFGKAVTNLPSEIFFYGMTVGNSFTLELPPHSDPGLNVSISDSGLLKTTVTLRRVGVLRGDGSRIISFTVDGEQHDIPIKDKTVEKSALALPKADVNDPNQLGSPLPGTVDKIFVKPGDTVLKDSLLMSIGAMKMEVNISCPHPRAVVAKLCVRTEQRVDTGSLVCVLKPVPEPVD